MRPHCLALAALCTLSACSPTYNWRELALPGGQAVATFPCKPSQEVRRVQLTDTPVEMTVTACSTDGVMFAVGGADVVDPARVGPALLRLHQAAVSNVGGRAESVPLALAGITPHPQAGAWRIEGRMPDGRAVQAHVAVFSKGTQVFQLTVFGARLPQEPLDTFLAGLRWR